MPIAPGGPDSRPIERKLMTVLVRNIKISLSQSEQAAYEQALRRAGLSASQAASIYIAKASVDARKRSNIQLVYTVGIELAPGVDTGSVVAGGDVVLSAPARPEIIRGAQRLESRPVIVGFGPAGMFAGLLLAREGYRPIILERGGDVATRTARVEAFWQGGGLHPGSNVQFGEGGAGTFSDGKLTTRIGDPLCGYVLEELVRFGAPEEILKKAKPHVGTDNLRRVVQALREEIIALGGEVRFESCVDSIGIKNQKLASVGYQGVRLPAQVAVLAPGHSARDTFELLLGQGVELTAKPFAVGVRIEHLQSRIDAALYGNQAGNPRLPVGEYQLSYRQGERAVYTFCMCPGGLVVPAASEQGGVVTNGMSEYARNRPNANAALVVSVGQEDFGPGPLAGVAFQRKLEQLAFAAGGYRAPMQTAGSFLEGRSGGKLGQVQPSYAIGVTGAGLAELFPSAVTAMLQTGLRRFDRSLQGFAAPDAVLTGVESRTSSPVRITRGESHEAVGISGLYPCGEGAGYAGGIMSAAVDGLKTALKIIARYAPPA